MPFGPIFYVYILYSLYLIDGIGGIALILLRFFIRILIYNTVYSPCTVYKYIYT